LIRDLQRGGNDQKEVIDGLIVDGFEIDSRAAATKRAPQARDHERAAMGNRDMLSDAGRPQRLASLQHLEQHSLRLFIELEQPDQLFEHRVLRGALELELDGVFGKELAQAHFRGRKVKLGCSMRNELLRSSA